MASVDAICAQIAGCGAFFASQHHLLGEVLAAQSVASMASSISRQIEAAPSIDMSEAVKLNDAISASPFSPSSKAELAGAVARKVMGQSGPAATGRKVLQQLTTTWAYLTQSEADYLAEPTHTMAQKTTRLVDRLTLIGLFHASEASFKHIVATLAAMHSPNMAAPELHGLVLDLKRACRSRTPPLTLHQIHQYQACPRDLPKEIFDAAYGAEAPGDMAEPAAYKSILARVPVRCTKKDLHPAAAVAQSAVNPMQLMQAFIQQFTSASAQQRLQAQPPHITYYAEAQPNSSPAKHTRAAPAIELTPRLAQGQSESTHSLASSSTQHSEIVPFLAHRVPAGGGAGQIAAASQPASISSVVVPPAGVGGIVATDAAALATRAAVGNLKHPAASHAAIGGEVATEELDSVAAMEAMAKCASQGGLTLKKPASAPAKPSATAAASVLKRPAAQPVAHTKRLRILLGCGKCRGSHIGCIQCRDPSFGGARWQC